MSSRAAFSSAAPDATAADADADAMHITDLPLPAAFASWGRSREGAARRVAAARGRATGRRAVVLDRAAGRPCEAEEVEEKADGAAAWRAASRWAAMGDGGGGLVGGRGAWPLGRGRGGVR